VSEDLRALTAAVRERGSIGLDDADQIQRILAAREIVDDTAADLLFELNQAFRDKQKDPAWEDVFVYAISRFTLEDETSPGVVDDDEAAWLIDRISQDGNLDRVELALLVNIVARASSCDPMLQEFVLQALRTEVRSRGVLDSEAADLVRRVIYAHGSGGGEQVDRAEADFLFDLHRSAPAGTVHSLAWLELFVEATCRHLLEQGDEPGEVEESGAQWLLEQTCGDQAEAAILERLVSLGKTLPSGLQARLEHFGLNSGG
jgi:hypothetical protein